MLRKNLARHVKVAHPGTFDAKIDNSVLVVEDSSSVVSGRFERPNLSSTPLPRSLHEKQQCGRSIVPAGKGEPAGSCSFVPVPVQRRI